FPGHDNTFVHLAKSLDIPVTTTWRYNYESAGRSRFLPYDLSLGLPWQVLRLARLLIAMQRPGYAYVDRALSISMDRFIRERRMESLDPAIRPLITGLGYGFFHDTPAAYVLKNLAFFRPHVYQLLEGGSQSVWERVARDLDVRLDHAALSVERTGSGV